MVYILTLILDYNSTWNDMYMFMYLPTYSSCTICNVLDFCLSSDAMAANKKYAITKKQLPSHRLYLIWKNNMSQGRSYIILLVRSYRPAPLPLCHCVQKWRRNLIVWSHSVSPQTWMKPTSWCAGMVVVVKNSWCKSIAHYFWYLWPYNNMLCKGGNLIRSCLSIY